LAYLLLHNIFVGNSAAVIAAVPSLYVDVAAIPQTVEVAAYRAFGYVQRITDFSLWDNDFSAFVSKLVKDEIQQLAGYGSIYISNNFVFGQLLQGDSPLKK